MATISQDSLRSFVISFLLACKSFLFVTLILTNTGYHAHSHQQRHWCPPSGCWSKVYPTAYKQLLPLSEGLWPCFAASPLLSYRGPSHAGNYVYGHQKCISQIRSLLGEQQKNLRDWEWLIEEMMLRAKVAEAFVHEEESMADLTRLTEQLFWIFLLGQPAMPMFSCQFLET